MYRISRKSDFGELIVKNVVTQRSMASVFVVEQKLEEKEGEGSAKLHIVTMVLFVITDRTLLDVDAYLNGSKRCHVMVGCE